MTRETAAAKADRLLAEGRIIVEEAGPWHVAATCHGDSGHVHRLGYTRDGWWCTCPHPGTCSHLLALQHVTAPRRRPTPPAHAPKDAA